MRWKMSSESFDEMGDQIKEQYGYKPSGLIWFLAGKIAYQYVRMAVAAKLGKETATMENMINHHYTLIRRNIENDFVSERARKYGTRN